NGNETTKVYEVILRTMFTQRMIDASRPPNPEDHVRILPLLFRGFDSGIFHTRE
ncbi:hypothetical protein L9F63_021811, partial [Diploptera punctata]